MTPDQKWEYVELVLVNLQGHAENLRETVRDVKIAPESVLCTSFDYVEASLLETLSLLVDDDFNFITWYVYDCDYGMSPKEAGPKDNIRMIETLVDLRWLVESV